MATMFVGDSSNLESVILFRSRSVSVVQEGTHVHRLDARVPQNVR